VSEAGTVVAARPPAARLSSLASAYGPTVVIAVIVYLVGYDSGGFAQSTRDELAILLWWLIIVAVGLGLWPLAPAGRKAVVVGALLGGFGLWTLLSAFWAPSAENAYSAFTRVALYLAVFTVAIVAGTRRNVTGWCNGLALGITGIALTALVSRFFPTLVSGGELVRFIPGLEARLSFPIGYWNGLAMLCGLGVPLLLRGAVTSPSPVVRGLFVAPLPALAAVIYLTSSRGGVLVAIVGAVAFLVCTSQRWAVALALVVALVASAATALVLHSRHALVNGPVHSSAAESQGRSAVFIVAGICILTAVVYGVATLGLTGRSTPPGWLGWGIAGIAVVVVVIGILASHPSRRIHDFTRAPKIGGAGNVSTHLFSSSGSGRWQFWTAGFDEWKHRPLYGTGAGSYPEWWTQHGSLTLSVENAHSLYVEALGELGIVGFVLLIGAFVTGIVAAATRLVRRSDRTTLAALLAVFVAYAVGAGIDWMWQLTIVSAVGIACLGLAVGPATALAGGPRRVQAGEGRRFGFGMVAALVVGWLLICAIAIELFSGIKLQSSQSAASSGDLNTALKDASDARSIQSWASQPYLQIALVEELQGNLAGAETAIRQAIAHDRDNWQLWLVAARIETKLGNVTAGLTDLHQAERLNPRTPIFSR
jgi:O-antigen ligase/polysaccharide polymerase Wzy-like membrane protein